MQAVPVFEYRFVNPSTGRKRKGARRAFDQDQLIELLGRENVYPDEVTEVAEPPPTEPQMELMRDRGIGFPIDVTKAEASNLITNYFDRREVADATDFDLAEALRVETSRFASKATLYRWILADMVRRGPEDLATWYVYRVYRDAYDRDGPGIRDPLDSRFVQIGAAIAADRRLRTSLSRAATQSRVHFRYFGEYTTPDGVDLHGDGDRSEVYKFALDEIAALGLLDHQIGRAHV